MYSIGKFFGSLISPVGITLVGLAIFLALTLIYSMFGGGRLLNRIRKYIGIVSVCWLWVIATPLMSRFIGFGLEREFLVDGKIPKLDSYPKADAILLLGGSMGYDTNVCNTAEMWSSADRVWNAARLYHARKANKIIVTGGGVVASTKGLLLDFGIPANAIIFDETPRNTEEEARASASRGDKKVFVVTSAWHMKRTMMMFKKYAPGVDAIPAPTDFENTMAASCEVAFMDFLPNPSALVANSIAFHEWLGIFVHYILR